MNVYSPFIIRGGLIVDGGTITIHGGAAPYWAKIVHDVNLLTNPPPGFVSPDMQVIPGTWIHDVAPP